MTKYRDVHCHYCQAVIPGNEALQRSVVIGISEGSTVNYETHQQSYSGRAYSEMAFFCRTCAAEYDKEDSFGAHLVGCLGLLGKLVGCIMLILFAGLILAIVTAKRDESRNSARQGETLLEGLDIPKEDPAGKICVIREWNGVCSEYVRRR